MSTDFFDQLDVERVPVPTHHIRVQYVDSEGFPEPASDVASELWDPVATTDPAEYAEALQVVLENYHENEESRSRSWIETIVRS